MRILVDAGALRGQCGVPNQLGGGHPVIRMDRDANHRVAQAFESVDDDRLPQRRERRAAPLDGAGGRVAVERDDHQLIRRDAPHDVAVGKRLADAVDQGADEFLASLMADHRVDPPDAAKLDEKQREKFLASHRVFDHPIEVAMDHVRTHDVI